MGILGYVLITLSLFAPNPFFDGGLQVSFLFPTDEVIMIDNQSWIFVHFYVVVGWK